MNTEELQGKIDPNEVKPGECKALDYIRYNDQYAILQQQFYIAGNDFLDAINNHLPDGRAKDFAVKSFEESYMWIGKAIRDAQVADELKSENIERRG